MDAVEVVSGEGVRSAAAGDAIGLAVDGGGWGDDVASIGEEIDALTFLAGEAQMGRQVKIEVGQGTSSGLDGAGFDQIGTLTAEGLIEIRRVEVEDDEMADIAGDDAERCCAAFGCEPLIDLG